MNTMDKVFYPSYGCDHPGFIQNLCIKCGLLEIKCSPDGHTTVPMSYIHPTLTLTLQEINRRRDQNLQVLLTRKKLHLILDLDNTLVHATRPQDQDLTLTLTTTLSDENNEEDMHEFDNMLVKVRPGARAFLEKARAMFDISVYTMGNRVYGMNVATLLSGGQDWTVISRDDCTTKMQKGLDVVLSHKRVVLIVDDSEKVWAESDRGNVVRIKPYYFFGDESRRVVDDVELDRVFGVLTQIHSKFFEDGCSVEDCMTRDVRPLLQGLRVPTVGQETRVRQDQDQDQGVSIGTKLFNFVKSCWSWKTVAED